MSFSNLELALAAELDPRVYEELRRYRDLRGFATLKEAHADVLSTVLIGVCNRVQQGDAGHELL